MSRSCALQLRRHCELSSGGKKAEILDWKHIADSSFEGECGKRAEGDTTILKGLSQSSTVDVYT